jgi:hypothetical protein
VQPGNGKGNLSAEGVAPEVRVEDAQQVHQPHHPIRKLGNAEGAMRPLRVPEAGHVDGVHGTVETVLGQMLQSGSPGVCCTAETMEQKQGGMRRGVVPDI